MKRRYPPYHPREVTVTNEKDFLAEKWKSGDVFIAVGLNQKINKQADRLLFPATSDSFACNT